MSGNPGLLPLLLFVQTLIIIVVSGSSVNFVGSYSQTLVVIRDIFVCILDSDHSSVTSVIESSHGWTVLRII